MQNNTEISYRIAAVDTASPIGLLLALYDTLAGDLLRAIEAVEAGDIERRCKQLNHAYAVLGQLESWLNTEGPTDLDESLQAFYGYLRGRMLEASIKQSAPMLRDLVQLVLQIRTTWQQWESVSVSSRNPVDAQDIELSNNALIAERVALSQTI